MVINYKKQQQQNKYINTYCLNILTLYTLKQILIMNYVNGKWHTVQQNMLNI